MLLSQVESNIAGDHPPEKLDHFPSDQQMSVKDYLNTLSESGSETYGVALEKFARFLQKEKDMNIFPDFVDHVEQDLDKRAVEKQHLWSKTIQHWIDYLATQNLKQSTISTYVSAVQGYLNTYHELGVSRKRIRLKGDPTRRRKYRLTLPEIRKFIHHLPSLRDRSIAMCLFQSGLSISDLLKLNYEAIRKEFEAGKTPLAIEMMRKKTQIYYYTFFGRDSLFLLRKYLDKRGSVSPNDPLFIKRRGKGRVTRHAVEMVFKRTREQCDFIPADKVVSPHTLRAAFKSQLLGRKEFGTTNIDPILVEYYMGHKIPENKRAYITIPLERHREIYERLEQYLSLEIAENS